jgi:hypothetical protein
MSDEPPIRLAAVDVRERPDEDICPICNQPLKLVMDGTDIGFCLECYNNASGKSDDARIRQLEQERDEARDMLNDWHELAKDAKPDCGGIGDGYLIAPMKEIEFRLLREATSAFLAKHPQPAKEQVE